MYIPIARMKLVLQLVILNLMFFLSVLGQTQPWKNSVDPATLDTRVLLDQIAFPSNHQVKIHLADLEPEFSGSLHVRVEIYYRKSANHLILDMGSITLPVSSSYLVAEEGTTYYRISNDQCFLVLKNHLENSGYALQEIVHRSCTY